MKNILYGINSAFVFNFIICETTLKSINPTTIDILKIIGTGIVSILSALLTKWLENLYNSNKLTTDNKKLIQTNASQDTTINKLIDERMENNNGK